MSDRLPAAPGHMESLIDASLQAEGGKEERTLQSALPFLIKTSSSALAVSPLL